MYGVLLIKELAVEAYEDNAYWYNIMMESVENGVMTFDQNVNNFDLEEWLDARNDELAEAWDEMCQEVEEAGEFLDSIFRSKGKMQNDANGIAE